MAQLSTFGRMGGDPYTRIKVEDDVFLALWQHRLPTDHDANDVVRRLLGLDKPPVQLTLPFDRPLSIRGLHS